MGLANIGMSCFANSVLNSLYFVPQFYDYFHTKSVNSKLALLVKKFVTKYAKEEIHPQLLRDIISHFPQFPIGSMASAFEFLCNLLQSLYEEKQQRPSTSSLSHAYESKNFRDIFSILLENSRKCSVCDTTVSDLTEISALSCTIPQSRVIRIGHGRLPYQASIESSLDAFLSEQTDSQETSHLCRKCGQDQIHVSKKSIKRIGPAVIIYLQRFSSVNPQAQVTVPLTLNMSKYIEGVGSYSLCSAIHHSGSLDFGHYKCFANSSKGWMCLNDRDARFVEDPCSELSMSTIFIYRVA